MSIFGKGPTQGLGEHSLTADKMQSISFSATGKRFCLSLHYNGTNSYLFVNGVEIIKFKAKDSEIIPNVLCLGNISKDFSARDVKKKGFYGTVYDFSVDYGAISVDDILGIHKYLIKIATQYKMFEFVKQTFLSVMMYFSRYLPSVNSLKCISLKNQEYKTRP